MRRSRAFGMILVFWVAYQANAQDVVIHRATPATVVERLEVQLVPQGFTLESANDKGALFTLDRGTVAQQGNRLVPFAHVVLELQFRFKQKSDDLSVSAGEEAVGERGQRLEFRKPVESQRNNLQRLLDTVRVDLERAAPGGTEAKRDSGARVRAPSMGIAPGAGSDRLGLARFGLSLHRGWRPPPWFTCSLWRLLLAEPSAPCAVSLRGGRSSRCLLRPAQAKSCGSRARAAGLCLGDATDRGALRFGWPILRLPVCCRLTSA